MNTTDFLNIASAICPERDCIVFEGRRWTYAQISQRVNRLVNALRKLGVEKGDRIGMLQVNCNQYVETYYAAAKLGAIFVPLNFRAKTDELSYMMANAEVKILLAGGRYLDIVDAILPQLPIVIQCIFIDIKDVKRLYYEDLMNSASSDELFYEIRDEDITILLYTAGTTGRPKGVPLRHQPIA